MSNTNESPLLIIGASGFVGRQLAAAGLPEGTRLVSRSPVNHSGYASVGAYDGKHVRPLVASSSVIVHLAALTRERRRPPLDEANVALVKNLLRWIEEENSDARFILLSSDLAASKSSPYGRSKAAAEAAVTSSGLDALALRASAVAGYPIEGVSSTIGKIAAAARKKFVPLPAAGAFEIRPLWIEDMRDAILSLAERRGGREDAGLWSMTGEPVLLSEMIRIISAGEDKMPRIIPLPLLPLIAAGRFLAAVNPSTTFPLDFLESVREGPVPRPPDIFRHLGLQPLSPHRFLQAC